jgi:opacity protein-like surface antigen
MRCVNLAMHAATTKLVRLKNYKTIILALVGLIILSNPHFLSAQRSKENGHSKELPYFDKSKKFSILLYGTYVSSAELLDNVKSDVPFLRDASVELKGGYGYGGEVTYNPEIYDLGIILYLSSEYLKVKDDGMVAVKVIDDTTIIRARFTEEYKLMPIEAGLKWSLPVSTDNFKIFIGGGAGIYFGERTRTVGRVSTTKVSSSPGFSLNVLSGVEYYIGRNLSVDFQFKFREGSFDVENEFPQNVTVFDNVIYSRIIVDGVRLSAGLKYNF